MASAADKIEERPEGFTSQQIVINARDRAESAVAEKLAPLYQSETIARHHK